MGSDEAVIVGRKGTLIAVPNVSEGRNEELIAAMSGAIERTGTLLLDTHVDRVHNRSVFTLAGNEDVLVEGVTQLARATKKIDLTSQRGVHPRVGVLDVCPFVIDGDASVSVRAAGTAARNIGDMVGLPVILYGEAARREETRSLPELRRGGLEALMQRIQGGLTPDEGPERVDPAHGVVCVGARHPLVAFNVWLECDEEVARRIANRVRTTGGGPPGVRALGWAMGERLSQVSMNLISPGTTGIDRAFDAVTAHTAAERIPVVATEIVGLPFERHMPDEKKEAARLLLQPGRSLESVLTSRS